MRIKLLMGHPSRDEVVAARELLITNGFVPPMVGDWWHHQPGQLIENDCVVVGSGGSTQADAYGRWVQVAVIEDLAQVFPDAEGRPELRRHEVQLVDPEREVEEYQGYKLVDRGRGWFDVVDADDRVQNEKAMRDHEARELVEKLNQPPAPAPSYYEALT